MPDDRAAQRQTIRGRVGPGDPDWVYVPIKVPPAAARLTVRLGYDRALGVIDLGLFGPAGRFRGWSGGARSEFTVAAGDATPGYLAGPLPPGTWQVILGPYRVPGEGLPWRLEVEAAGAEAAAGVATAAAGPDPSFTGGLPLGSARPPVSWAPASLLSPPDPPSTGGLPLGPARPPVSWAPASLSSPPEGARVLRDAPGWYRGDLHVHTLYSDGSFTPAEALELARSAGLDFLVTSEHNTSAGHQAFARQQRPDLLLVAGEEVTTRAGHAGAIGLEPGRWVDWRYRPEDGVLPRIAGELRAEGVLLQANHPFSSGKGASWRFGWDAVEAVEVWNGSESSPVNDRAVALWDQLLRAGLRLVATGGSDAHRPPDQVGHPQTVVRAERLAAAEVVAALRAGRCWLARSARVELDFAAAAGVRRAGVGERLRGRPGETVSVGLRVGGAPGAVATLHGRDGTVHAAQLGPGASGALQFETGLGATPWLRAEVRGPDGELVALTNPIWLGAATP